MKARELFYESPAVTVVDVNCENVICSSGDYPSVRNYTVNDEQDA